MVKRPPPIRTDASNRFAHHTMRVRFPAILERVIADLSPSMQQAKDAVRALADEVLGDKPIGPLQGPAPDLDQWAAPFAAHASDTWLATDWFFAETYLYRRMIEAVRYFETEVDPFAFTKADDLAKPATWESVEAARSAPSVGHEARITTLLEAALWGNRLDLSYAGAAALGMHASAADLLVDDRSRAVPLLLRRDARIALVADNTGAELLLDLVLAAALIEGGAREVVVHVKGHPTFVSDAIAADVRSALSRLGAVHEAHFHAGRLRIAPDVFWNSPAFIDHVPPHLAFALARCDVAIVKGDANYRRLVGDAIWAPITAPRSASGPLPCPFLALRTLKSDPIVGLPGGLAEKLDIESSLWRVDGKRGVAQLFSA